jgi:hypothetical protein
MVEGNCGEESQPAEHLGRLIELCLFWDDGQAESRASHEKTRAGRAEKTKGGRDDEKRKVSAVGGTNERII